MSAPDGVAHKKKETLSGLSAVRRAEVLAENSVSAQSAACPAKSFELDRSLDFAGTKATGADAHSLCFAAAQIDADGEQVQLPATAGSAVRVADQVTRSGSAATAVTYLGHVKAASFV